jgi:pimeloyl-ACP methyl ester carboxylesterase
LEALPPRRRAGQSKSKDIRNYSTGGKLMDNLIQTRNGAQLYCRSWGTGRPVVFVHGWAVNCDVWQYQMGALSEHARCIAYDKQSHDRSSDPGRGYDYDTLADDLAAVLELFDLRDAVLVAIRWGPAEIVRCISRHGAARVSRLVLISSALLSEKIDQSLAIVVETTLNSNRANCPLKSKTREFDGRTVGFRP